MTDKKRRPWITFFSHSGQEIRDICTALSIYPSCICSNNPNVSMRAWCNSYFVNSKWPSSEYRRVINDIADYYGVKPLITLHGWMRIIPADICNDFEIYNGHPALINEYPELKGKDMQLAVINKLDEYPYIGSVIHKCVPEVDSGEIVEIEKIKNFSVHDKRLIFDILRNTSLQTWLRFLPTKLYLNEQ